MQMKIEQKINGVFALLGIAVGVVSNSLQASFAIALAVGVYIISFLVMKRFVRTKKNNWLVGNSAASFFLIWWVVFVIIYNL